MSSPYRAAHPFDAVDAKAKWLDELPTALPPSGPNQTMFYFEGHPMIREALPDRARALYTSVRRGLPYMRVVATGGIAVEGSAHALVMEVMTPLLRLGRMAKTSLSVHQGLASISWRCDTNADEADALAIQCLVALRNVRSPVA